MDISEQDALKIYDAIANDFNSGRPKSMKDFEPLVNGRPNLFSVVVSILYDISRYSHITGNQAANLTSTILLHFLPKYAELVNSDSQEEIRKLELEIDRLTTVILNDWGDDGNTNNSQDGNRERENR